MFIEDLILFGDKTTDILGSDMMPFVNYIIGKHRLNTTPFKIWYEEIPLLLNRWAL